MLNAENSCAAFILNIYFLVTFDQLNVSLSLKQQLLFTVSMSYLLYSFQQMKTYCKVLLYFYRLTIE